MKKTILLSLLILFASGVSALGTTPKSDGVVIITLDPVNTTNDGGSTPASVDTIFSDSFSGSHPGSWSIGHDGGGGSYAWAWPNDYAHCYADPYGSMYYYPDNLHVYMERRSVNLSGYSNASLFFNYIVDTEASWDYFTVNVRDQSGSWHEVWRKSGITDPLSWSSKTLNLDSFAGQTNLYIQFRFDSDGSVSGNPYDGVYIDNVSLTAVASKPDLIAYGISVSDTTVDPGQNVTVYWTAKNDGTASCGSTQQGVMWSTNNIISRSDTWLENEYLGGLSPGQSTPEAHTITIPGNATPGSTYYIGIIADYDYDEDESNESNNDDGTPAAVTINLSLPDLEPYQRSGWDDKLVISNVTGTTTSASLIYDDENIYVDYCCFNSGDGDAGHFRYGLYIDDILKKYVDKSSLAAGYSSSITDSDIGVLSAGNHTFKIICDYDEEVNESDEGNNEYSRVFYITPRPEVISPPTSITGNSATYVDKSNSYTAGGASSNLGHSLQYQFDWGDGNYSAWGSSTQSHSWGNSSTYNIKARARCASHPTKVSNWSGTLKSVSVIWVPLSVSVNPGGAGSVTKNPDRPVGYSYNETVWLTAIANSGYTFDTPLWSGDASGSSNPISVTMDSSKNITANFSTLPDIRIEPLTLDFESLVATTEESGADSGESINNATLVSGSVNDSNDIDSPYYYYYFDKKKPLILDVNQIALWSAEGLLQRRFERFGISDADLEPWPISGWTLANTPVTARFEEGIDQLVTEIVDDKSADFVSPVFIGEDGGPVIITQEIRVRFEKSVTDAKAKFILAELQAGSIIDPNWGNRPRAYRLQSTARNGLDVLAVANVLAERPEVKFAVPGIIFTGRSSLTPNDPGFSNCWGIHNTGQSGGTADMDMDGPEAWDLTTGDPSIIVVVIDTGVQQNHPDIHQITGSDFTGQGGNGDPVNQCDNHGTAVAGCVSAVINNNLGTVGIAPDAVVASARTFISNTNPCNGTWTSSASWTVAALQWANSIGARVTNNSNSYGFTDPDIADEYQQTRDNGIVHFASAGNNASSTIAYPSSLPTVNAVAAVDRNGDLASFSNFGTGLAFSAPGQSIYTTDRTGSDGYSSGDYTTINGTSFASPYTAGVAALALSMRPTLDATDIEQILQQSAVDLGASGYDTTFGWGFVNAFEAIKQASEAQDFTIYNDGSGILTVSDIDKQNNSSWIVSISPAPPFDIDGGNSQVVTVSVDPTGLSPDTYSDRLLVYSNDPDESPYPGGVYVNLTVTCVSTTIEQPPQDITICEGQDAVFDIAATGSEPLHYQWKKDSVDVGSDSSTLILPSVQLEDDGLEIWCEVTNVCDSVVVSTSAFLTVYPWPTVTINPNPDQLNAGWFLDGPNGYTDSNNGDETIADLEFGSYTITWSTIPSWNTPLPNPDTKNLSVGNSINFIGNYQLIADLNNDYSVDYADLARLANEWLWTGLSGGIPEDIMQDGIVNFLDFGLLANNWLAGI